MPIRPAVKTVDEYVMKVTPMATNIVTTLRQIILETWPDATETIKYGMPTYLRGKLRVSFDTYQDHVSFMSSEDLSPLTITQANTAGYMTGQKRINIQFDQAAPVEFIKNVMAEMK
ncbi:DUF1801 domain-containing protein [Levilactobacillus bambusae]|uniref:DUF1801 domain-containing protein n=1 Tax=Levilactobacillus bambusae TaxID=2024736 RepID=A0A2V1MZ90_9LACO|nr:DUF1801 domain-containing protein [Levilactobacillus bambusae]PWG00289.1 DUF1801 domain-containing protein [Levilactobacillus bambusae]